MWRNKYLTSNIKYNYYIGGYAMLKERIVCTKCKNVTYRDIESHELITKNFSEHPEKLVAIYIKKNTCDNCKNETFTSEIVDMDSISDDVASAK